MTFFSPPYSKLVRLDLLLNLLFFASPGTSLPRRFSDKLVAMLSLGRFLEALLGDHVSFIRQGHDDVLVASVLEVFRLDLFFVPFDRIRVLAIR